VSVFDSRTANVHVENTNELAYTPLPLRILAALAQACQDIKAKLNAEIKALESQTPSVITKPACGERTAVGRLLAGLSSVTLPEKVEALSTLTPPELERLEELNADLSADPGRISRRLRDLQQKLEAAINRLRAAETSSRDVAHEALREAALALEATSKAAATASSALFSREPLPDVGSDTWKVLWEAARGYSRTSAYPERPFPVTGAQARCVLCQQPLEPQAARRLESFEAFVQDETGRLRDEAQARYDAELSATTGARVTVADALAMVRLVRDELGNVELAAALRRQVIALAWRFRAIIRRHTLEWVGPLPPTPALHLDLLLREAEALATRSAALVAENDSPARAALIAERDELKDRRWLATIKVDVLAQIDRLKLIAALKEACKETATNRITSLSGEIARGLVTNRLRARFAQEATKLGVSELAVELQQARTSAGVPYFQVRLISKPSEPPGSILSEGEHRSVALAAFLAELATTDSESAIVFDDPVSSLDHIRRDRLADRLAEEGQKRQVIVFTHDIAFVLLLGEACRDARTTMTYRLVARGADASGYCHPEPPVNVTPLDQVIAGMRAHLDNVRVHHSRGDQAKWHSEVRAFQERLRSSWERAVEEALAPVLRRLARKVSTSGLKKVAVLTLADSENVRVAFERCSALLHSQPGEINPALPPPPLIEAEIQALADWIADVRARQDKA
jgi:hypothetical protein